MEADKVPQDSSVTYGGHKKLLYATGRDGYTTVQSSGWHAEELATCDAVAEYQRLAKTAWEEARAGRASPLNYHMYRCRMDTALLAQVARVWRWRVNRHLRAEIFNKLSEKVLQRYANALDMTVAELKALPEAIE